MVEDQVKYYDLLKYNSILVANDPTGPKCIGKGFYGIF